MASVQSFISGHSKLEIVFSHYGSAYSHLILGEFEADLTHVWFLKNLSCTHVRIQKLTTNDWGKIEE